MSLEGTGDSTGGSAGNLTEPMSLQICDDSGLTWWCPGPWLCVCRQNLEAASETWANKAEAMWDQPVRGLHPWWQEILIHFNSAYSSHPPEKGKALQLLHLTPKLYIFSSSLVSTSAMNSMGPQRPLFNHLQWALDFIDSSGQTVSIGIAVSLWEP